MRNAEYYINVSSPKIGGQKENPRKSINVKSVRRSLFDTPCHVGAQRLSTVNPNYSINKPHSFIGYRSSTRSPLRIVFLLLMFNGSVQQFHYHQTKYCASHKLATCREARNVHKHWSTKIRSESPNEIERLTSKQLDNRSIKRII